VDPYLLNLKKSIKNPLINNNIIKINIFVAKFFSKIKIVDFSNIKTITKQRVFNISIIILTKKISKLIKSLLNRKVLKLNGILNKVLKVVALIIIKNLAKITNYYFYSRIILRSLKEFIIIILYKKGKKDYCLLNSYKLITFKNILVKVLKKHVANIIFKAIKKYRLLFQN